MADINTNLSDLTDNAVRISTAATAIASAITAKGGTVSSGDGLEDFASDIATIPSGGGGGSQSRKDVNFYDYDGTIVNSYTAAEFANLSAMPSNPSHDGLTAQGWNWSLADAKAYVSDYGKLNIGQMYTSNTPNGVTLLHIRLGEGRLKPYLGLTGNSSGTAVSIDWGDGSTVESVTLNTSTIYTPHEYASDGEYIIAITVTSGTIGLIGASSSTNLFRKSSFANTNVDKVYANILTKAEIGTGVTYIGDFAFQNCFSLTSITIPSTVTYIGMNAFSSCGSLTSVTLPSTVTSIGTNAFSSCGSLTSITLPSGVTFIGNGAFQNCYSLTSITIPSTVTSIGNNAFNACRDLTSITIPSGVTSIGDYTFYIAAGLAFVKFESTTPPTVSSSDSWNSIPSDCIIYVPTGTLSAYKSASNYPNPSTYTYKEY